MSFVSGSLTGVPIAGQAEVLSGHAQVLLVQARGRTGLPRGGARLLVDAAESVQKAAVTARNVVESNRRNGTES